MRGTVRRVQSVHVVLRMYTRCVNKPSRVREKRFVLKNKGMVRGWSKGAPQLMRREGKAAASSPAGGCTCNPVGFSCCSSSSHISCRSAGHVPARSSLFQLILSHRILFIHPKPSTPMCTVRAKSYSTGACRSTEHVHSNKNVLIAST